MSVGVFLVVAVALLVFAASGLREVLFRRKVWRLLKVEWRALGDIEEDLGMMPSRMGSFPQPVSRVERLLRQWCADGRIIESWGSTGRTRRLSYVYLGEPIYALAAAGEGAGDVHMTTKKVYIYPDFFARFLKQADWQPAEYDGEPLSGAVRATHDAEFSFAGKTVRAVLLSDGEAAMNLEDLARLFGVTADELNAELNKLPQDLPALAPSTEGS